MLYSKKYVQQTVKADSPEEFDFTMNSIFAKAAKFGKEPDVHFFEGLGLCACVRYWTSEEIPESISERYEKEGKGALCSECSEFVLPFDKRIKKIRCEKSGRLVTSTSCACDEYYILKEEKDALKISNT